MRNHALRRTRNSGPAARVTGARSIGTWMDQSLTAAFLFRPVALRLAPSCSLHIYVRARQPAGPACVISQHELESEIGRRRYRHMCMRGGIGNRSTGWQGRVVACSLASSLSLPFAGLANGRDELVRARRIAACLSCSVV